METVIDFSFLASKITAGCECSHEIKICLLLGRKIMTNLAQLSISVMPNFLWPHRMKHARLPCPSPTTGACSNLCSSSQWCHPTISSCRPILLPHSIFPSISIFSNESALHIKWPKYWSFNFSISPSNEYSGLISFRMKWLDLLAVQGTLKCLLQHHSLKHQFLYFHTNCEIICFSSVKNTIGSLIGIAWIYRLLWIVYSFSLYWFFQSKNTGIDLHLFVSSLISFISVL